MLGTCLTGGSDAAPLPSNAENRSNRIIWGSGCAFYLHIAGLFLILSVMATKGSGASSPHRILDSHIHIYIPSHDRDSSPLGSEVQEEWLNEAFELFGRLFGGATALDTIGGRWRDDDNDGQLVADHPLTLYSYSEVNVVRKHKAKVVEFMIDWGKKTKQGEVAILYDERLEMYKIKREGERHAYREGFQD